MIRFSLSCDGDHGFEAWFGSNADFDSQRRRDLIACPECGSTEIEKALMAPAVAASRDRPDHPLAMDPGKREMMKTLREMAKAIRAGSEDVGDRFPEIARKIHHGEAEARVIIGKASGEEAKALIDEGIEIAPLPDLPDDMN